MWKCNNNLFNNISVYQSATVVADVSEHNLLFINFPQLEEMWRLLRKSQYLKKEI